MKNTERELVDSGRQSEDANWVRFKGRVLEFTEVRITLRNINSGLVQRELFHADSRDRDFGDVGETPIAASQHAVAFAVGNMIYVRSLAGEVEYFFQSDSAQIIDLDFSPSKNSLLSASSGNVAEQWDLEWQTTENRAALFRWPSKMAALDLHGEYTAIEEADRIKNAVAEAIGEKPDGIIVNYGPVRH